MPLLKPYIDWPGVTNGIRSLIYTTGHGITPGHLEITINAQDDPPAMFGDLSFGDGVRDITLRNCMVVDIRDDYSTSGHYQHLTIQDRRWAWRYGSIPGQYNQLDDRGKLIPWTIRSPTELALLCLREMGESNFQIKLPTGLSSNDIPQINRLLITGENFPQSLANPETIWDGVAPAVALQRLAETYGCRVVWDPVTDVVGIGPIGDGDGLPPGGDLVASSSVGVNAKPAPYAIAVTGGPMRHQLRWALEPVGEEWDGRYVPISELSYAPKQKIDCTQRIQVQLTPFFNTSLTVGLTIGDKSCVLSASGDRFTVAASLRTQINAADQRFTASMVLSTSFTIEGPVGVPFEYHFQSPQMDYVVVRMDRKAQKKGTVDWSMCAPPTFSAVKSDPNLIGVEATDRLTVDDAMRKAQGSVWKCYRIMITVPDWVTSPKAQTAMPPYSNESSTYLYSTLQMPRVKDPKTDSFSIVGENGKSYSFNANGNSLDSNVQPNQPSSPPSNGTPGSKTGGVANIGDPVGLAAFGAGVVRRHQFHLLPTKVDQVVPSPPIAPGLVAIDLRQPHNQFSFASPDYYNGYSRDQEATVSGTFSIQVTGQTVVYNSKAPNCFDGQNFFGQRLYVPFQVIPQEQMIKFASPVFRTKPWGGGWYPAQLVLETSALFQHAYTSQVRRPQFFKVLGGPGPIAWYRHEDVECHLIARYDNNNRYQYTIQEDFDDGATRAQYYLDAHAAEFQLVQSEHRTWNAIYNISLTGKVQQVSWSIQTGPSGYVRTQAGLNTEFSVNQAPYPARRMVEDLAPNEITAMLNVTSRDKIPDNAFVGAKSAKSLLKGSQ